MSVRFSLDYLKTSIRWRIKKLSDQQEHLSVEKAHVLEKQAEALSEFMSFLETGPSEQELNSSERRSDY
jgi:hypothetical protein